MASDKNNNNPPFSQISVFVCVPEQVVLDSSSSFPQSLSPSHSQRRGMQRLFLHLNLSVGQVCWSGEKKGQIKGPEGNKEKWDGRTRNGGVKEGCEVQMSERESRYFSWFYDLILVFSFWTGIYFVWDGNMSALQPQTDRPADREVFHIHRYCYTLSCTDTHTHSHTWCTQIMHKISRYKHIHTRFRVGSLISFWHHLTVKFRLPEVIWLQQEG